MAVKIGLGAARAVGARAASIFASFVLTIVVARTLGLEASGLFFLVLSAVAGVATFGRFGTDNLALKLVGGGGSQARHDVWRLVKIAAAASVVGTCGAFGVAIAVRGELPGIGPAVLAAAASAVIPQALSVLAGSVLRARGRIALGTTAELGSTPALAAIAIVAAGAVGDVTLDGAITSLTIASWITGAWSLLAMHGSLRARHDDARLPPATVPSGIALGSLSAMMGTSLIFYVLTWVPVFLLSAAGAFEAVSLYTASARLVGFITLIPAIQVSYLAPRFAQLYQARELPILNRLAGRSALVALGLSAVPSTLLVVAPGFVLEVTYGVDFRAAAPAVVLLSLGALTAAAAGQVNQLMLLCDSERFALAINGALLVIWLAGGWLLASNHGLVGVAGLALGTTLVYNVAAVVRLHSTRGIRSFAWR